MNLVSTMRLTAKLHPSCNKSELSLDQVYQSAYMSLANTLTPNQIPCVSLHVNSAGLFLFLSLLPARPSQTPL